MRFWLARHSEVPIREQLVTQIVLGILSDDLRPGRRLPSTRELARRFHVHANTISAAYRQLERERWVEFRRGSGVYIRRSKPDAALSSEFALDQLIVALFRSAREIGAPLEAVRSRLRRWLALQPPDRFLVIEPDDELRRIVIAEIQHAVTFPVAGCALDACHRPDTLAGAIPVALPSKVETVRKALPAGTECLALHVRSVPGSLAPWLPARPDFLIGIASRWPNFLKSARTMLVAAGFHPDSLVFRDARKQGWQKGLRQTAGVVCDSLTATRVPDGCRAIPFPLLAESSLAELQHYQDFITRPLS
jgi:DNA-binding transcriptional regulator YhcF (GntR family)